MKVFFTCSRAGSKIDKYRSLDIKVLEELRRLEVSIESTIERTYLSQTPELRKILDLTENESAYKFVHDSLVRRVIRRSDAMVVEASYPSFRLGFEAFYALSLQKPVLVLSKFKNYANLINQPHFFGAKYTDFTLPDEIEKFVKHVKSYRLSARFNLFISDDQKSKIDKMSKQYNVSQSDYIRGLIDKDSKLYGR